MGATEHSLEPLTRFSKRKGGPLAYKPGIRTGPRIRVVNNKDHTWNPLTQRPYTMHTNWPSPSQPPLHRPPSSGPRRNRYNKGRQKRREAQHPYQYRHVSSGAVTRDRPTGIHPVHAQMDAFYNTRAGGVWRPPSGNPTMNHHDATRNVRVKSYKKDPAARAWRKERTDMVDLSIYQIPIAASGSRLI